MLVTLTSVADAVKPHVPESRKLHEEIETP